MSRLDPVDVVGVIGVCLVAIGVWQYAPGAAVVWMGVVLITAWIVGAQMRTGQ